MDRPPPPRLLAIAGRSGGGKTRLVVRLLPCLKARGFRVATLKHSHHTVDPDPPGKDSRLHREAGAAETVLATPGRTVHIQETPDAEPALTDLLARLGAVDLVLLEGFKGAAVPRLEAWRPAAGEPPLAAADPGAFRALAAPGAEAPVTIPVVDADAPWAVADRVVAEAAPIAIP